jgi:hypothetical protein
MSPNILSHVSKNIHEIFHQRGKIFLKKFDPIHLSMFMLVGSQNNIPAYMTRWEHN